MLNQEEKILLSVAANLKIVTKQQADKVIEEKIREPLTPAGDLLIKMGYVSNEQYAQIKVALERFRKDHPEAFKPGGKKDLASSDDIYAALEQQTLDVPQSHDPTPGSARIIACPNCGTQHPIYGLEKNKQYTCKTCGALLDTGSAVGDVAAQATVAFKAMQKPAEIQKDPADPFVGRDIAGCKILSKLGQGGMGAVYKAEHVALAKTVAIKILPPGTTQKAQRDRFLREARTAAKLEHPNIVQVHNVGEEGGYHYIVMQYVEGKTLAQIVHGTKGILAPDAMRIIREAARGLDAAHRKNMVHRDIKPDNIMVTNDSEVKVMDFGLAKSLEGEMEITKTGQVLGTPYYMSPEQCGNGVVDHQSDIYSLGVTFYYLVTGHRPFTGDTPLNVMMKHMNEDMPDPRQYNPALEEDVVTIIRRMMAKQKKDRYQSAKDVISDIDRLVTGTSLEPLPAALQKGASGSGVAAAPASGKGVPLALIAVVAVVIVAVVVFLVFSGGGEQTAETAAVAAAGTGTAPAGNKTAGKTAVTQPPGAAVASSTAATTGAAADVTPEEKARLAALSDEAAGVLDGLRKTAQDHINFMRFDAAAVVFDDFPEKYRPTPSWSKAQEAKEELIGKAKAAWESVQTESETLATKNLFDEAVSKIMLYKSIKLGGVGIKAEEQEKSLLRRKTAYDGSRKTDEVRGEQEAKMAQADALYKDKKYSEAKAIFVGLANSQFPNIKGHSAGTLSAIETIEQDAKKDFDATVAAAAKAAAEKNFDDAVRKISAYIPRAVYFPEYSNKAKENLANYQKALAANWKDKKAEAAELEKSGKYADAHALYTPFETSNDVSIAAEANQLAEHADRWAKYNAAIEKADRIKDPSSPEFGAAVEEISKFASSPDPALAAAASARAGEMQKKYNEALAGKYPDMAFIPGGDYVLGSDDKADGNPPHKAFLKPFFIDKNEVTNEEYAKFVNAAGYAAPKHWKGGEIPAGEEKFPVSNVACADAEAYAKWAGKRLPAADEWETAAGYDLKENKLRRFPWGNDYAAGKANVNTQGPQPVGSFPNGVGPFGCLDMAGNVWEWTSTDPEMLGKNRVAKGGSYYDKGLAGIAVPFVYALPANSTKKYVGFRCARDAR
jgi:formylglycine-generating enzyme required for sulfatase activity/predicted Ser/Thr protein kinase